MKIGIVGPTYDQRSLPFDAQRSVNLFPVMDEAGKETASMYGTPGLALFTTAGSGPHRGAFKSGNNRCFFVSGASLYEVSANATAVHRGSLLTSMGSVSMAEGITQLAICDGRNIYCFTYETNSLEKVIAAGLPDSVGYVTNIDGFFVVNEVNTGRFHISGINDILMWDPLDYATAESSPDSLEAPVNAVGLLWLMGEKTTEVWANRGASDFTFRRNSNGVMKAGVLAKHSILEVDNTIVWVGQDEFGSGMVYRANGFTPQRISTTPIERRIQNCAAPQDIYAWAYQEDGHVFYVISGGGLDTSLAYDFSTQQWHERAFLNEDGNFEPHLGACHIYAFGKHLIGDRRNGNIYEMSLDLYSDNGEEIARERVYTHISDENKRVRFNALEIGIETGVGNPDDPDPRCEFSFSRDGGRTYSTPVIRAIGAIGEYKKKVVFRRFGVADQITFKLRITGKTKTAITGSYLR